MRTARRFGSPALALALALVASLLLPLTASAAEGRLTILFTGDNGGEVSPCG